MGIAQNGWFTMENPSINGWFRGTSFMETPIYGEIVGCTNNNMRSFCWLTRGVFFGYSVLRFITSHHAGMSEGHTAQPAFSPQGGRWWFLSQHPRLGGEFFLGSWSKSRVGCFCCNPAGRPSISPVSPRWRLLLLLASHGVWGTRPARWGPSVAEWTMLCDRNELVHGCS